MLRRLLREGTLSIFDQGIVSLSNFLTSVLLARSLTQFEFGAYTVLFAVLMGLGGLQNALITGPLRVLGVRRDSRQGEEYLSAQTTLQAALSGLIAVSAIGVMLFVGGKIRSYAILFAAWVVLYQIQELARSRLITDLSMRRLLLLDLTAHGGRIVLLAALLHSGSASLHEALGVIALSLGLSVLLAYPARFQVEGRTVVLSAALRENWRFGRWILLQTLMFTASTQVYVYLSAAVVGARGVAGLGAAQSIMNTLNVLLIGSASYMTPLLRTLLLRESFAQWRRMVAGYGVGIAVAVAMISAPIVIWAEALLSALYGDYYAQYAGLIRIMAIAYTLQAANGAVSAAFRSTELTKAGFHATTFSAVATLAVGYPLVRSYGITGAAVGLLITQLCWAAVYTAYILRGALQRSAIEGRVSV